MANEPIMTIVGNLTADPELKYVGSGTPVASFTVAVTPAKKNQQTNEWDHGEAMFFRCTVWGTHAENVTESLHKGMRVFLTGRFTSRTYQRNDGTQGTSLEIQVNEVGPSLRYTTAQVARVAHQQTNSPQPNQPYQPQTNTPQNGAHDPAGNLTQTLDPWTQQPGTSNNTPF
ncbi:single-stranded DNA-binding protein [Arcanobacterium haemolyticum]